MYPSNKDTVVLKNFNMTIYGGKKTAIVGESGCGKSTCMQLLERFYDVDSGSITLDSQNIE